VRIGGILPGDALRGKGRALGPQSRPWALLAAVLTGMLSTVAAAALGASAITLLTGMEGLPYVSMTASREG
jgi:hypothetical protein